MRVLFTISNWTGDYFCMVPFGWALQAAGHDVRVACAPEQVEAVARTALIPVPILRSTDLMRLARFGHVMKSSEGRRVLPDLPLPLHPTTGEPMKDLGEIDLQAEGAALWMSMSEGIRESSDEVVTFAQQWRPDVVCYSLMSEQGPLAARAIGVPSVFYSPGLFGAVERGTHLDMGPDDPTGSFIRHGLDPWRREDTEYVIDPTPGAAALEHGDAVRMPVQYIPYNGTGAVPAWLREPAPKRRVCVLWGRSATGTFGAHWPALRTAIDAAAETGAEVVLTAGPEQLEALGELPDGVRVMKEFPFQLVLDTCDAVIHHASAGSLMTAAVAGVPQLSLPLTDDTIAIAERATVTGAVRCLPGLVAEPEEIRQGVKTVLGEDYRDAALRLKRELTARPTPAQLVPTLERIAGR